MYNIRNEDVDDKGNVNPDAALYPMYMGQYIDNRTGKSFMELPPDQIADKLSDVDREYDNSLNAHPNRTVQIHLLGDKDPFQTVGPDLKRGYSALAFANKDKRHGDDYFSGWHKIDHDKDMHTATYTPLDKIEENSQYAKHFSSADKEAASLAYSITPGELYKGFYALPLIIEADDSDVINYNDVIKDNYDPTRDYLPEVQLKRVIKKSVMPNALTNNKKMVYVSKATNAVRHIDNLIPIVENYAQKVSDVNFDSSKHKDTQKVYSLLQSALNESISRSTKTIDMCRSLFDILENADMGAGSDIQQQTISADKTFKDIEECLAYLKDVYDWLMQGPVEQEANMEVAKSISSPLMELCYNFKELRADCKAVYYAAQDMSDAGLAGNYVPDTDILKKATQKGGAFDWYDSSTYSDERLKNIYSGCRDVVLSDKQLKYIYDDFMKFKKDATQSSILKGLMRL
jgi:hypothetical protein